jgi:HEAT repeat protein
VQRAAVEVLATSRNADNNEALLRCSAVSDGGISDAIVEALAAANRGHVGEFLDELMGFADEPVLAVGARVLGHIGDTRSERLLSTWVSAGGEELRTCAIRALGRLGTQSARDVLLDCLADPSEAIRCAATDALVLQPFQATLDAFPRLLDDPSARVRGRLAKALARSEDASAVELLSRLSGDPDDTVRMAALESLLSLTSTGALETFTRAFDAQPREIRERVVRDDRSSGLAEAILQLGLSHPDPAARRNALAAIERLRQGDPSLLSQALRDPEAIVRVAAVRACQAAAGAVLGDETRKLLDDPSARVREAVRRAYLSVVSEDG